MKKLIHIEPFSKDELASAKIYSSLDGYTKAGEHPIVAFIKGTSHPFALSALIFEMIVTENHLGRPTDTVFSILSQPLVEFPTTTPPKVWVARLKNGAWLIANPESDILSLVRSEIERLFEYNQLEIDMQTVYLSFFTHVLSLFLESMDAEMELEEIHTNLITGISLPIVISITGDYIKTTLTKSKLEEKYQTGEKVALEIGVHKLDLEYATDFDSDKKSNQIYLDSRGNPKDPYLSIYLPEEKEIFIGDEIRVG